MENFLDKKKLVLIAVVSICLLITCICGVTLVKELHNYKVAKDEYDTLLSDNVDSENKVNKKVTTYTGSSASDIKLGDPDVIQYELPDLLIDFRSLCSINPDCIGWIYIPSVGISYPIVQSADNTDYVKTTFNGTENLAGCIFSDCRIAAPFIQKTILYGHNMKNGTMFHKLFEIEKSPTEKSDIWIYLTGGAIYHYKVESVQRTIMTDTDVYGVSASYDDTLVLSTCVKNDKRLVVIAKRDWAYN